MKLKGGAVPKSLKDVKLKISNSKEEKNNTIVNLFRSSKSFYLSRSHNKCPVEKLCQFCMVRSVIGRMNEEKGRQKIIPVELEAIRYENTEGKWSHLHQLLSKCMESNKELMKIMCPVFTCLSCNNVVSTENDMWIDLKQRTKNHDDSIYALLELKKKSLLEKHKEESHHSF